MVEKIAPVTEVSQVMELISAGKNFLLSGGAGSGKTYSLVEVIREVKQNDPFARIACMTYTNAGVRMIEGRVGDKNLQVSTIHDFLWDCIKHYQRDLKISLAEIINSEDFKLSHPDGNLSPDHYLSHQQPIRYKQNIKIADGIISHDEVILLASYMFKKYPKLADILKDKFNYIFIDEYQDTEPKVVEILLRDISNGKGKCIIGFFGDSMQGIYDDGIGDLNPYLAEGLVTEVIKTQNRRNPQKVITLANRLRIDKLQQQPSEDLKAPNMEEGKIKKGTIRFVHSRVADLDYIKKALGWAPRPGRTMRELNLTHNLIAGKAGFRNLMDIFDKDPVVELKKSVSDKIKAATKKGTPFNISEEMTFDEVVLLTAPADKYQNLKRDNIIAEFPELYQMVRDRSYETVKKIYLDKDQLVDDKKESTGEENRTGTKRSTLIKHLFKLYDIIKLYQEKKYNEFIRKTGFQIASIADKQKLQELIGKLSNTQEKTIAEVIELAHSTGICPKEEKIVEYIENQDYAYHRIGGELFKEFINVYEYLEGFTPFSTQHKIKGDEFHDVLVVLEEGGWTKYKFEYVFNREIFATLNKDKMKTYPQIKERTLKLFYVCCTRAMENLIVYYQAPSAEVLDTAREWFDGNVEEII